MNRYTAAAVLAAATLLASGLVFVAGGLAVPSGPLAPDAASRTNTPRAEAASSPTPAVLGFEAELDAKTPRGRPRAALGMAPNAAELGQKPATPAASPTPPAKPLVLMSSLVPILMYHNVRPIDFATTNSFVSALTLPPTEFEKELRYLRDRGFTSVSLRDVAEQLAGRAKLPARPVVLTFDDGFENNHRYAAPLLKSYGFTGTFFIITSLVGETERMTWSQVTDLAAGGNEIGSHTMTHPDLSVLSAANLTRELVGSRDALERMLGRKVVALSYPSGSYNADTVDTATRAGYVIAVTTRYGAVLQGGKPMELPRIRIQGTDDLQAFRWKMEQFFPTGDPVKQ